MYPVLIEPMMAVQGQTTIWAIVYAVLILAIFISGYWALRHPGHKEKETAESLTQDEIKPITLKMRLIWVFLAFIPSSLMLGVTTNITYNIASAPFLWIIPLALYLLTFIIAFAKRPIITERSLKYLVPIAIVTAFWFSYGSAYPILAIIINLCAYFIIALGAHTRLVNLRPTAKNLTEFYIWMSLGGVIGGVFNALISPIIFTHSYELPLVLVLSTLIFFTPKWLSLIHI